MTAPTNRHYNEELAIAKPSKRHEKEKLLQVGSYCLFIIGCVLLLNHFLVLGLHLAPANPIKKQLAGYITSYVTPLWEQDWRMFAPEPSTSSLKMWHRYQTAEGEWSEWRDAAECSLRRHQENRFCSAGQFVCVHQSICRGVSSQAAVILKDLYDSPIPTQTVDREYRKRISKTEEFKLAVRYVTDLSRIEASNSNRDLLAIEFLCVACECRKFSQRNDETAASEFRPIRFPVIVVGVAKN